MVSSDDIGSWPDVHNNFLYFLCCTGQFMISKDSCISFDLLGDEESQQKVFEEMTQGNVKPNDNTYSELMKTCIMK